MAVTIQKLAKFDPPGWPFVDDGLTDPQKLDWSKQISSWMDAEITAKEPDGTPLPGPRGTNRTPLTQFFNGTITAYDTSQKPVAITWIGFPNLVKVRFPNEPKRWQEADKTRNVQDEYLEWSLKKDNKGRIVTVTYTCEGPEYWNFLASENPDSLTSLYLNLNSGFKSQMKPSDWLGPGGKYNPLNKWNSTTTSGTIVHLVQVNNTLGAEVDIAAQGTVIRKGKDGKIITDKTKLTNCSGYGQPSRNSDPTIGDGVNSLARNGIAVSIANPVAIYIHSFNTANFQLDVQGTGENMIDVPTGTFRWQRGNIAKNMGLRLQVKIPDGVVGTGPGNKGQQLTVSDIVDTSNNQNILYGAQFADYITMTVKGVGISGGQPAAPLPCPGQASGQGLAAAQAVENIAVEQACDASTNAPRGGTRW